MSAIRYRLYTTYSVGAVTGITVSYRSSWWSSWDKCWFLQWYTTSSRWKSLLFGTSFNPVGVMGSGITDTNTAGTTPFYVAFSSDPDCRTFVHFTINPAPNGIHLKTLDCCLMMVLFAERTTATLTASGGSSYIWSTGATSASINTSTAGTYTVTCNRQCKLHKCNFCFHLS